MAPHSAADSAATSRALALFGEGLAYHHKGQLALARAFYERAVRLHPDYADAWHMLGVVASQMGNPAHAVTLITKAIALDPGSAAAHYDRGNSLCELNEYEAAIASYDQAIEFLPDCVEAHNNRGNAFRDWGRHDEALASYERAIEIKPDYCSAHINRGVALHMLRRNGEALASYDQALKITPDSPEAHWNRSLCYLQTGDFERGWREHEWRWRFRKTGLNPHAFPQPLWLGAEPLQGKAILLHSEAGFGDTIQFCRYAKLIGALGARVLLYVPAPLRRLMAGLEGVAEVLEEQRELPAADYHCPLMSLPLAFKTDMESIPSSNKYLEADPRNVQEWKARLGDWERPRIGIAWSGSTHKNDARRSIGFRDFAEHLPRQFQYISLQKEVRDSDRAALDARPWIADYASELNDFADTAALCELVDAVVSVDTSVAHLAGALGKPVRILLAFNSDWRWLLDRENSPWYPTAKLFRQDTLGDWDGVLTRVKADLERAL